MDPRRSGAFDLRRLFDAPPASDIFATFRKSDINVSLSMRGSMKNPVFLDLQTGFVLIKKILVRGSNRPPVGPKGHDVLTSLQALLGSVVARLA